MSKPKVINKPFRWHNWKPPVISLDEAIRIVQETPQLYSICTGQKSVSLAGGRRRIDATPGETVARLRTLGWKAYVPEGGQLAMWQPYLRMDALGRP